MIIRYGRLWINVNAVNTYSIIHINSVNICWLFGSTPAMLQGMSPKAKAARKQIRGKTSSKKASNYHHGALRAALIRSAREILESEGYEALTLRAAARRAGVSQAAPYNHFADKAALLAAIAALGFKEFAAAMRKEMDAAVDPKARLSATGIAYVAFATSNPGLFKLMFGSSVHQTSGDADLDAARTAAYEVLSGAVHAAQSVPREAMHDEIESLRSWAFVHGLATMINAGTISPGVYGANSARELAATLLGSPPMEKKSGASTVANKYGE
jgi:AcrR family transcriptional regulator